MIKKIFIGLVVVIAGFLIIVAMQPAEFRVERSATISAPASAVFAQVNDLHKWAAWSPYENRDPAMQRTFEGEPSGPGAIYKWSGNSEVGEGSMTIIESHPNERILIKLEFIKPFAATNTAEFTFEPQGDQTVVTWSLSGENNFISKAICMFMDMDKMVGGDFEQGLAKLKSVVEDGATKDLTISRVFDAPVDLVWKAWSEEKYVKQWWGPTGFTAPLAQMDFRVGGTSLVCMSSPQFGDLYSTWHYREIVPTTRIEYIHNLADKDGNKIDPVKAGMPADFPQEVRNVITFKDLGGGKTEMTVTEYGYVSDQWYELSKTGLEQCLDKMAASLIKS
jgi:uncharacterized protein YndB with AHSA1/START domain